MVNLFNKWKRQSYKSSSFTVLILRMEYFNTLKKFFWSTYYKLCRELYFNCEWNIFDIHNN